MTKGKQHAIRTIGLMALAAIFFGGLIGSVAFIGSLISGGVWMSSARCEAESQKRKTIILLVFIFLVLAWIMFLGWETTWIHR